MGTSLIKNYNVEKEPYMTGGFKNMWKIYKGTHKMKDATASVFVFDKKSIDNLSSKEEREEVINILKKEAQSLPKFKHPGILGVQEALLEDKTTLAFVTEYVSNSLSTWISGDNVSKLEIKLIFIEMIEVIRFLHEDAKVIHFNLSPDSIFIDEKGKLKLSGFCFSINDPSVSGSDVSFKCTLSNALPDLCYCSPESILSKTANYKSDIFSFGCCLAYLLNKAQNGSKCSSNSNIISISSNNIDTYKRFFEEFRSKFTSFLNGLEQEDKEILSIVLSQREESRPTISALKDNKWFHDSKLNALTFIDNLEANDQSKNTVFLQQFPKILNQFDEKIIRKRIMPKLLETLKLETLMVAVTPCVVSICEISTSNIDFEAVVWPHLKNLFKLKQMPAATLYFLITKIEFISLKLSQGEFTGHMLNIVCKALDCNVPKIQNAVLLNLAAINKKIDSQSFKNQIYTRLSGILINTTQHDLRIAILKCLKDSFTLLDQNTINNDLLSTLEKLRKTENKMDICKLLVEIYEDISVVVNIEV